jgi:hypothetical protein
MSFGYNSPATRVTIADIVAINGASAGYTGLHWFYRANVAGSTTRILLRMQSNATSNQNLQFGMGTTESVTCRRGSTILATFANVPPLKWYALAIRSDQSTGVTFSLFDDQGALQEEFFFATTATNPLNAVDINTATNTGQQGASRYLRAWGVRLSDVELLDEVRNHPTLAVPARNQLAACWYSVLLPDATNNENAAGPADNVVLTDGALSLEEPPVFDVGPPDISGGLAAVETGDVAAFSGLLTYFGSMAVTEAGDVADFAGTIIPQFVTGTFAVTEGVDGFAATGDSSNSDERDGGIQAIETGDVAAFSGSKTYEGSFNAEEQRDLAEFSGTIIPKFITGSLATLEPLDVAAITDGTGGDTDVGNTIAIRDANCGIGMSPESKWKDGPPSWGREGSDPTLTFPMSIGHPQNDQNWSNNETTRQARLVQAISDTPAGEDVIPGWASYVAVKTGEWVWCINRTSNVADNDNPIGKGDAVAVP